MNVLEQSGFRLGLRLATAIKSMGDPRPLPAVFCHAWNCHHGVGIWINGVRFEMMPMQEESFFARSPRRHRWNRWSWTKAARRQQAQYQRSVHTWRVALAGG